MLHRFRAGPFALSLALLGTATSLSACGGGAEGATGTTSVDAPVPPPGTPPGPPPPPPQNGLDAQLSTLALRGGAAPVPAAPAQDAAHVALGKALFFDRILSGNRNISCATCHDVGAATGDALSVSIGTGGVGSAANRKLGSGALIARNAPPLFQLARQDTMFWDGRVTRRQDGTLVTPEPALNGPNPSAAALAAQLTSALAAQAMFPPTSREEMRGQAGENEIADATTNLEVWARLMRRLVGSEDGTAEGLAAYRDLFAAAYPEVERWDDFNFGHAARAIAAFTIASFHPQGSPFDSWLGGNLAALSDQAKRGGILFYGRADCARCHGGPRLTDDRHHAIGVPQVGPGRDFFLEDTGRGAITGDPDDRYRFRTPSLRNAAITGPWMHDGAYTTLGNAVRHYRNPEESLRDYDRNQLSALLRPLVDIDPARQAARAVAISPLVRGGVRLNNQEVAEIVAFLEALTDPDALALEDRKPASVPSGLPIDDE